LEATHPVQTTHQTVSLFTCRGVRPQIIKGAVFQQAPPQILRYLALQSPSGPILQHQLPQIQCLSYIKVPRGLFRHIAVIGIFTDITISPEPQRLRTVSQIITTNSSWAQVPELTRTRNSHTLGPVIVTAAVYWGFNSMRSLADDNLLCNLPAPGRCPRL